MKLSTIKAILSGLPDESDVEIYLIDDYQAELKITTPDNDHVSLGYFDYDPIKKEE